MDGEVSRRVLVSKLAGSQREGEVIPPLTRVLAARSGLNDGLHDAIGVLESRLDTLTQPEAKSEITCPQECIDAGSELVQSIHSENIKTQSALDRIYSLTRRLEI